MVINLNDRKRCIRGERCKNPHKDVNGELSLDQFSDGDTNDEVRGDCKICHLYFDTTPQGTMEEWRYRHGGIYVVPTGNIKDGVRCFTTLEVAILWGVSTAAIRKFKDPKKTDIPLQPLKIRGRRNSLLFTERIVNAYAENFATRIDRERQIGESKHDEYLADLEQAQREMLQQPLDLPERPDAQNEGRQELAEAKSIIRGLLTVIYVRPTPLAVQLGVHIDDVIRTFEPAATWEVIQSAKSFLERYDEQKPEADSE